MMGYYGYGWGMGGMWIFGIIFWVFIIWLIFWLIGGGRGYHGMGMGSAEEILKARYAKGEISKKEYDRMKKDIEK